MISSMKCKLHCILVLLLACSAQAFVIGKCLSTSQPIRLRQSARIPLCMASPSMYDRITKKLSEGLQPLKLVVTDNSHMHAGHEGLEGREGGETHFAVEVVSDGFDGLRPVQRHQKIYGLLKDELQGINEGGGIHALQIVAKTPKEAAAK